MICGVCQKFSHHNLQSLLIFYKFFMMPGYSVRIYNIQTQRKCLKFTRIFHDRIHHSLKNGAGFIGASLHPSRTCGGRRSRTSLEAKSLSLQSKLNSHIRGLIFRIHRSEYRVHGLRMSQQTKSKIVTFLHEFFSLNRCL